MIPKPESTAVVAISRRGASLGVRIRDALGSDTVLYAERRFADVLSGGAVVPFDLPLRRVMGGLFSNHRRLVLMMPVGAAVRLLTPHIGDKHTDPAVVCVDDAGRFVVSLLSGHIGGADALAERVAHAIGATPVITSASYALGTLAVDLLGAEFGWRIEAGSDVVTRAAAAVVNGEAVGVYQDAGECNWWGGDGTLPANIHLCDSIDVLSAFDTALLITDRIFDAETISVRRLVTYHPRSLVVGVGCRRGVDVEELWCLLTETFAAHSLSVESVRLLATAGLKRDEPGIRLLSERLGVGIRFYDVDALNANPGPSGESASQRLLGVVGVAEPAALLASRGGSMVVPKVKSGRATMAVVRHQKCV